MNNQDLLPFFMRGSDWAEKLAEGLIFAIRPGVELENLRTLYGLGMLLALAIGKELMKVPEDDELIGRGDKR